MRILTPEFMEIAKTSKSDVENNVLARYQHHWFGNVPSLYLPPQISRYHLVLIFLECRSAIAATHAMWLAVLAYVSTDMFLYSDVISGPYLTLLSWYIGRLLMARDTIPLVSYHMLVLCYPDDYSVLTYPQLLYRITEYCETCCERFNIHS